MSITVINEDFASKLDAEDPLKAFKSEFLITDPSVCYLDGNSLGRLPKKTIDEVQSFLLNEWGPELVDGWSHWIDQLNLLAIFWPEPPLAHRLDRLWFATPPA